MATRQRAAEPPSPAAAAEAKRAAKAERARLQRALWARYGNATRADYNRTPTAMPGWVQEEVVARHRRGETRGRILREVRVSHRLLTEYHVKRILGAFRRDPEAFRTPVTADIVAWARSMPAR